MVPENNSVSAVSETITSSIRRLLGVAALVILCSAAFAFAQSVPSFNPSGLVSLGDHVRYGSYKIVKIGEGVYQINDPGVTTGKSGAFGVDMYLMLGTKKALMVDLGNNYILGYVPDLIAPRPNAAEELRNVVYGLAGKLPLEIAITHAHPDHDGMTQAFAEKHVPIWMSEGEDSNAPKTQYNIDPSVYSRFTPGEKTFDLGGGRVVDTFLVRGHTNGSTVYLLKPDMLLFTGDAIGSGFGQAFPTIDRLKTFAADSQKLVDSIKAQYTPYERYALRVYTGHSYQNAYGGFFSPNLNRIDVGFLDWRFVQDVAFCANAILKGQWLVEGSGLRDAGKMPYTALWPSTNGQAIMNYGAATIIIPLKVAYQAAGLDVPQNLN